jgi:hypothetical protein
LEKDRLRVPFIQKNHAKKIISLEGKLIIPKYGKICQHGCKLSPKGNP